MLTYLHIRNYALIDKVELVPDGKLNIITGETGAGKSIMLGALGLVMGNRADTKVLFHPEEKCVVEATFTQPGESLKALLEGAGLDVEPDTLLRREISPQGKSRAFVNDTPVSLETLRLIADALLDIHSQHDTLELASQTYQLSLLDAYAGLTAERALVAEAVGQYRKAEGESTALAKQIAEAGRQQDFNIFQLTELDRVAPLEDELEILEQELRVLENTEEIKQRLALATTSLGGGEQDAVSNLRVGVQHLDKLAQYSKKLEELAGRAKSALEEVRDIVDEVEREQEGIDFDPARQLFVTERVNVLNQLLVKHGLKGTAELLALRQTLATAIAQVEGLDDALLDAKALTENTFKEALKLASALTIKRRLAIPQLEAELKTLLAEVGMPNATLKVELGEAGLNATGVDSCQMLFSANKGFGLQQLKNAASGGEFSRLMLCIKYVMAQKTELPTLIFDEIDTGISGEIALRVARLMGQMASQHQLIVITHMAQIAARASSHYFVYKAESGERTFTNIRKLTEGERLQEVAQMIGGANPSKTALENARELIAG
jgi:DNA repair protein RecN (Recombination protein N)